MGKTKLNKRALAEKIAHCIFTVGGSNIQVDHLHMMKDGKYIAGWAKKPMADVIEEILSGEDK